MTDFTARILERGAAPPDRPVVADVELFIERPERSLIARRATVSEELAFPPANAIILVAADKYDELKYLAGVLTGIFQFYPRPHMPGLVWIEHDPASRLAVMGITAVIDCDPKRLEDADLRQLIYAGTCVS